MKKLNRFNQCFDSAEIGNGAQIMAWVFAILNLPGFIFSIFFFYAWPITIPGMILYVNYWRSGFNLLTADKTRTMWIFTLVYNLVLFTAGSMILLSGEPNIELAALLLPSLLGSGMAGIALKALQDHQDYIRTAQENIVIEMDGEIENIKTNTTLSEYIPVENWAIA